MAEAVTPKPAQAEIKPVVQAQSAQSEAPGRSFMRTLFQREAANTAAQATTPEARKTEAPRTALQLIADYRKNMLGLLDSTREKGKQALGDILTELQNSKSPVLRKRGYDFSIAIHQFNIGLAQQEIQLRQEAITALEAQLNSLPENSQARGKINADIQRNQQELQRQQESVKKLQGNVEETPDGPKGEGIVYLMRLRDGTADNPTGLAELPNEITEVASIFGVSEEDAKKDPVGAIFDRAETVSKMKKKDRKKALGLSWRNEAEVNKVLDVFHSPEPFMTTKKMKELGKMAGLAGLAYFLLMIWKALTGSELRGGQQQAG